MCEREHAQHSSNALDNQAQLIKQEIRHREVAQRKAARKRKAMMNQIVRKMKMSLRKRKTAGFNK
jgi:hypothetical protein